MPTQGDREEVLLNIRCIVKGYHLCRFEVNVGEVFTASKKRGERGNAFKVVNHRGQLGHLQSELVDPLILLLFRYQNFSVKARCNHFSFFEVCQYWPISTRNRGFQRFQTFTFNFGYRFHGIRGGGRQKQK